MVRLRVSVRLTREVVESLNAFAGTTHPTITHINIMVPILTHRSRCWERSNPFLFMILRLFLLFFFLAILEPTNGSNVLNKIV